mmetsp:Transcript_100901/g.159544  ORF Transcript_100901/g.159544 Transcript_100901/m.159544 type:complete len:168 (-) Transcript_100901:175-678(-)
MGGPATCDGKSVPATDNFQVTKFVIEGQEWVSCEQYFQAVKFTSEEYREKIRNETQAAGHGMRVWSMGNSRAYKLRPDWESVKVQMMYRANAAKFCQNKDLLEELLATRGSIRAANSTDQWQKWNSEILECVREELRPCEEQDAAKITRLRNSLGLPDEERPTLTGA